MDSIHQTKKTSILAGFFIDKTKNLWYDTSVMTRLNGVQLGINLVIMHDQEGFPLEMSLEMAAEQGIRPAWIGICLEASQRKWSKNLINRYIKQYDQLFTMTDAERATIPYLKN